MKSIILIICALVISQTVIISSEFDLEKYEEFLKQTEHLNYDELKDLYPSDPFYSSDSVLLDSILYYPLSNKNLKYSDDEIGLLKQNSFVVSERFAYPTFVHGLYEIWKKDLPIYLSNDLFLNTLHVTFKEIFKAIEVDNNGELYKALDSMLKELNEFESISNRTDSEFTNLIDDAKIYLSVSRSLNNPKVDFEIDTSVREQVNELLDLVYNEKPADVKLFSKVNRKYDFSLFKPRGFYDEIRNPIFSDYKPLEGYFRAIMWLGHINIYIENPKNNLFFELDEEDLDRHTRLAAFISLLIKNSGAKAHLDIIDNRLQVLVGRQDNITYNETNAVLEKLQFSYEDLFTKENITQIRKDLLELKSSVHSYNSSILFSGDTLKKIEAGSVFLTLGQRPLIDGFITSKVVFDNIIHKNEKVKRMLPNSMDVLFALGNNAVLNGLKDELNSFNYSPNLASVRYLIDGYDESFWGQNVYTNWLGAIRSLNPANTHVERESDRDYERTAAWQQKTATTQLSSWAELRHDYILQGKQPTSGANVCEYPDAYLEPSPEFFQRLINIFTCFQDTVNFKRFAGETKKMISLYDTLKTISEKVHSKKPISEKDNIFLRRILFDCSNWDCDASQEVFTGWMTDLMYGIELTRRGYIDKVKDPLLSVADIHTSPTDEDGEMVGWVKHIATGPVNLCSVVNENNEGIKTIYSGPVFSFFDFTTENFTRLDDGEWLDKYKAELGNSFENLQKPKLSQCYSTNTKGIRYSETPIFETTEPVISSVIEGSNLGGSISLYPQPATNYVRFGIDANSLECEIRLLSLDGRLLQKKDYQLVTTGNYIITLDFNENIKSGAYIYQITNSDKVHTGKLIVD